MILELLTQDFFSIKYFEFVTNHCNFIKFVLVCENLVNLKTYDVTIRNSVL